MVMASLVECPAEVFLRNGALLRMYKEYADSYDQALNTVASLQRRNKRFRAYLAYARKKVLKQSLEYVRHFESYSTPPVFVTIVNVGAASVDFWKLSTPLTVTAHEV